MEKVTCLEGALILAGRNVGRELTQGEREHVEYMFNARETWHTSQILLEPVWVTKDIFGRDQLPAISNRDQDGRPGKTGRTVFPSNLTRCRINGDYSLAKWGPKGCHTCPVVLVKETYGHSYYIPATDENLRFVAIRNEWNSDYEKDAKFWR